MSLFNVFLCQEDVETFDKFIIFFAHTLGVWHTSVLWRKAFYWVIWCWWAVVQLSWPKPVIRPPSSLRQTGVYNALLSKPTLDRKLLKSIEGLFGLEDWSVYCCCGCNPTAPFKECLKTDSHKQKVTSKNREMRSKWKRGYEDACTLGPNMQTGVYTAVAAIQDLPSKNIA